MVNFSAITKATFDALMKNPLTRVFDKPTYLDYATTREELHIVAASVDMSCLQDTHGEQWGLACELYGVNEAAEYEDLTGLVYEPQVRPPIYPEGINAQMASHTVERRVKRNEELNEAWARRNGGIKAMSQLIIDAYPEKTFKSLKHRVTGYNNIHPRQLLQYLLDGPCKLNTAAINKIRERYFRPFNPEKEDVDDFGKRLDEEQEEIMERTGIDISNAEKIQHYKTYMEDMDGVEQRDIDDFEEYEETDGPLDMEQVREFWQAVGKRLEKQEERDGRTAKRSKFESAASAEELRQIKQAISAINARQAQTEAAHDDEVNAVSSNHADIAVILKEIKSELSTTKSLLASTQAELSAVKSTIGKENANSNLQAALPAPDCSICGGDHTRKPNRRGKIVPESECSGREWPKHAGWWCPDSLVKMMNEKHGTNYVKPARPGKK